jgi:hypothetical protein
MHRRRPPRFRGLIRTAHGSKRRYRRLPQLPQHFGLTIKEIKDNPIHVRATGRLNKLYIELLKDNPDWATAARRHDRNHFMARLIFCFFAEDTDILSAPARLPMWVAGE